MNASINSQRLARSIASGAIAFLFAGSALAVPTYYLSPGANAAGDLAWQTAVGSFVEEDFDSYNNGDPLSSFTMGGVTVGVSLPNSGGGGEIFYGAYGPGGGVYGTVANGALGSFRTGVAVDNAITLTFSQAITGFGLWVFDNSTATADSFTMTVNAVASGVLDANPGMTAHAVEGFLGVFDAAGFTSLTISNASSTAVFELDHFQLSIAEPATVALLALGMLMIGVRRFHQLRRPRRNKGKLTTRPVRWNRPSAPNCPSEASAESFPRIGLNKLS